MAMVTQVSLADPQVGMLRLLLVTYTKIGNN
jgi:hypothetical protein